MQNNWTPEELEDGTLLPDERKFLYQHAFHTDRTLLGLVILFKYFQCEGRFPPTKRDVPLKIVQHIAKSLDLSVEAWRRYDWQGRTIDEQRAAIREFFGFRLATNQDQEAMRTWLVGEGLDQAQANGTLFGAEENAAAVTTLVYQRFRELHLEAPTALQITRLVSSALHQHEVRFCEALHARLPKETCEAIDRLLRRPPAFQAERTPPAQADAEAARG